MVFPFARGGPVDDDDEVLPFFFPPFFLALARFFAFSPIRGIEWEGIMTGFILTILSLDSEHLPDEVNVLREAIEQGDAKARELISV